MYRYGQYASLAAKNWVDTRIDGWRTLQGVTIVMQLRNYMEQARETEQMDQTLAILFRMIQDVFGRTLASHQFLFATVWMI